MEQSLSNIRQSSRELLVSQDVGHSVRALATAVLHGSELISRHRLNEGHPTPCFERALFHLCHLVDRPLCGQALCRERAATCCPFGDLASAAQKGAA